MSAEEQKCFQKWFPHGFIFKLKFTEWVNKRNSSPLLAGTFLKKRWYSRLLLFSAMIMYKNFLFNYHKITKVITVKVLCNEMNVLINCKTNIDK